MPEYMELALSDSSQVRRELPEAPDTLDVREQTAFTWVSWAGTRTPCAVSTASRSPSVPSAGIRNAMPTRPAGAWTTPASANPRFGKRPPKA
ncbi:hypothetical protein [Streptomyces sp. NBC_00829]|uniref:hypothetical protein n=1 Tax=Streptomyces sp. NBC_00829 TaxID=2903679 RepID=UPI003865C739|nr:hypothetical protein OG293_06065 [Streptomyces sp. NBC_00829]